MNKNWPSLQKPPVVVAIFQLKFFKKNFVLKEILQYDEIIKHVLPLRSDTMAVGVNFDRTNIHLGQSQIVGTSNAEISCYVYYSKESRCRLEISKDTISFISEEAYAGWSNYKGTVLKFLNLLSPVLSQTDILRTSIRFVNRFNIDDFSDPSKYFRTLITTSLEEGETSYPLQQYGFRLLMNPDPEILAVVNHNVENVSQKKYLYTLDIDVLDMKKISFDVCVIENIADNLREIKNQIFFDTITKETIDLCNYQ